MTTANESKIKRLQSRIARLENEKSDAARAENRAVRKINNANAAIRKAKNVSTIKSKEKIIQRENKNALKSKEKQTSAQKEISDKTLELNKALQKLGKANRKEQQKLIEQQKQKIQDQKEGQMKEVEKISKNLQNDEDFQREKEYDVFISHSSDDKDDFVEELAQSLKDAGVEIWYDSDDIGWGQSIRQEIDKGLSKSTYGIVVISKSFVEKYWTNYELDGILNKESSEGSQVILPIWHNITANQVQRYSQSLSNKLALNTGVDTIEEIVESVQKILE